MSKITDDTSVPVEKSYAFDDSEGRRLEVSDPGQGEYCYLSLFGYGGSENNNPEVVSLGLEHIDALIVLLDEQRGIIGDREEANA